MIAASVLATAVGAAPAAAAPKSTANWSACFRDFGPFQCAAVGVPLDYDQPNGAHITIAMVRLPASKAALRQGSLFINPGGPGGSGIGFAVFAAPNLFTQDVRDRFDIVAYCPGFVAASDGDLVAVGPTVGPLSRLGPRGISDRDDDGAGRSCHQV